MTNTQLLPSFQLFISNNDRFIKFNHVSCSLVPVGCDFCGLYRMIERWIKFMIPFKSVILNILTKLLVFRIPSMMPALKAAQLRLPLSLGTDINLLTKDSFSMR